MSTGGKEAG